MRSNLTKLGTAARDLTRAQDLIDTIVQSHRIVLPAEGRIRAEEALGLIQLASGTASVAQRFNYAGTVVTLYGAFEQFIEGLAVDAVAAMANMLESYEQLPEVVLRNHQTASLDVLMMMQADRYYGDLNKEAIVAGLHYANEVNLPVRLNAGVFRQHVANFRWKVICTFLERASFSPARTLGMDPFFASMALHFPDAGNPAVVIDDLAQRRNEVAHGWESSELLSTELLRAYINVIQDFAQTLYECVCSDLTNLAIQHVGVGLGQPEHVYRHIIAGFESIDAEVHVGDVIGMRNESGAHVAMVLGIQIGDVEHDTAEAGACAGLRLSKAIPQTAKLYRLPDTCAVLG